MNHARRKHSQLISERCGAEPSRASAIQCSAGRVHVITYTSPGVKILVSLAMLSLYFATRSAAFMSNVEVATCGSCFNEFVNSLRAGHSSIQKIAKFLL